MAQRDQFAGPYLAQCNACADALHVTQAFQGRSQIAPTTSTVLALQGLDGVESLLCQCAFTRRVQQPAFERATAHARHTGVQQGKQSGAVFAFECLRQFQIAPSRGGQVNAFFVAFDPQLLHVR